MKSTGKSKDNDAFRIALGKRVAEEIRRKGYDSPYDFWVQKAGDHISRATLNFIVAGKTDARVSTLRVIAKLLGVKTQVFLDFE